MTAQDQESLVRVICEGCIHTPDQDCPLCGGAKFYFWDLDTGQCYSHLRDPLEYTNESGEKVSVVRNEHTGYTPINTSIQSMLNYIEEWVTETPIRKWKLVLDENGWQACVWFNRYKKSCIETTDINLETCISRSYREIIKNRALNSDL